MAWVKGDFVPLSSRAVDADDDDDEDTDIDSSTVLRWGTAVKEELNKVGKLPCRTLVIAIGQSACAFIEAYVLKSGSERIGVICSGLDENEANSFSQESPTDKTCYIFRHPDNKEILLVQCKVNVTPEQAFSFTQQLMPCVNFEGCYAAILTSGPSSAYVNQAPNCDITMPLLRALKTPGYKGTPVCPYLEQPNTVEGLPAQLMSYCFIHNIPAVLYICYTNVRELDRHQMEIFRGILKATPVKDTLTENLHADAVLNKLVSLHADHSNLYT